MIKSFLRPQHPYKQEEYDYLGHEAPSVAYGPAQSRQCRSSSRPRASPISSPCLTRAHPLVPLGSIG